MKFNAVIRWMLFFALAILIVAGAGGFWLWNNSEVLIRQSVFRTFDRIAPDLELHIDQLQLLGTASLRLTGVEVRDRRAKRPILRAQELLVAVDESQLLERQQVLIRGFRFSRVDVLLKRFADGSWNWQRYQFQRQSDRPFIPPPVTLEDVRVQVELDHGEGLPSTSLVVGTPLFQAMPASSESYDFSGIVALPGAGDLSLNGACDLKDGAWTLGGRLRGLSANQNLLELAKTTAPDLAVRLQPIDAAVSSMLPRPTPAQTASAVTDTTAIAIGTGDLALRFLGVLDLDFHVEKHVEKSIPDMRLKVELRDGRLNSPVIPIRLTDVCAKFFWDNQQLVVNVMNARDGAAQITGELTMPLGDKAVVPRATLQIRELPITADLKPLFPESLQRLLEHFQPTGRISGDVTLQRFASGKWLPTSVSGTASDASAVFHKFRYPVTQVSATLIQRPLTATVPTGNDVVFDIAAEGHLGSEPIKAAGWVKNPGAEAEMRFDLHLQNLALDSHFRDALDEAGRKVIDMININGRAAVDLVCYRPPGLNQPSSLVVSADVRDATLRFQGFPYDVERLSGHVEFQSAEKSWKFTDLHGWHGPGELTGSGTFRGLPVPGELDLTIRAENALLNADLFNALNRSLRSFWTIVNPEGSISLTTQIAWTATKGHKPVVSLNDIHIFDASIYPKPFPYRMNIRSARLSYDPNDPRSAGMQHCEIHSLEAHHEGAPISANGWAEFSSDGFWQLHLNDVNATNLKPDDQLRAALPSSWRDTLSRLSQEGLLSLESSELDFRGLTSSEAPPTAAWKMNLRFADCKVSAGLDLERVSGIVKAFGAWDGFQLRNNGHIRLDQIQVLDMTIAGISGPYSMTEEELVLGSREVIRGEVRPTDVPPEERIQGQAYGGGLELDGLIDLQASGNYRFFGELKNALLEVYAARHLPDQPNLRGVVNSWIFVTGDGEAEEKIRGKGQLQINPAALYELPVILEMFSALSRLNFAVPNRTAFDYALMSFQIHDRAFWFDPIDLVGDAIALRGRGSVGFGGDVVLDFYSRPTRPRSPRIPFSGLLMSSATQWVNAQVRGTIDRPQVTVGSKIQLDESMRQFLSTFEPRPGGPIPALVLPRTFLLPIAPQARGPGPGRGP